MKHINDFGNEHMGLLTIIITIASIFAIITPIVIYFLNLKHKKTEISNYNLKFEEIINKRFKNTDEKISKLEIEIATVKTLNNEIKDNIEKINKILISIVKGAYNNQNKEKDLYNFYTHDERNKNKELARPLNKNTF